MKARLFADENRKWWTLAAVAFGLFMIMLDNTVVNVALPSIQQSLGLRCRSSSGWSRGTPSPSGRSCSRAASSRYDLAGRRLMFVVGLAIFTLSSARVRPGR